MEPEGSLRFDTYPPPFLILSHLNLIHNLHIPLPEDSSQYHPSIYAWVLQVTLSLRFSHQNPVYTSYLPHIIHL
jgi:hypothetical protein